MPNRRDLFRAIIGLTSRQTPAAGRLGATAAGTAARVSLPLGEMAVVGTRYHDAPRVAAALHPGQALVLKRDRTNRYDPWAIAVHTPQGHRLGFMPRGENRWIADLLDGGARIGATLAEGYPTRAEGGPWHLAARLSLLDVVPPPPPGSAAQAQVAHLLRAPPLLAQRATGPDYGARAVMLTGPCAGWQRTKAAEWVPPGALPWPAAALIAREFELHGGAYADDQTALALQEAVRLGLAEPDGTPRPQRSPPPVLAKPAERPRVVYRGWLDAPGHTATEMRDVLGPLARLSLRRAPRSQHGPWTTAVLDRGGQFVAWLPDTVGEIAMRLLDEGMNLVITIDDGNARPRENGGQRLPFTLSLRGGEPPETARRRMEIMLRAAELVPTDWDTERMFGDRRLAVLSRFVDRAERAVRIDRTGRLGERQARMALAWAERETGPA
jgi:hypothetical protein